MNFPSQKFLYALGRVLLSALFIVQGFEKLFDFSRVVGFMAAHHVPAPEAVTVVAVVIELVCGIMLVFGIRVKLAAYALAALTAFLTICIYRDIYDPAVYTQILKNLSIIGGLVYVIAHYTKTDGVARD